MRPSPRVPATENQRRAIATTLAMLDETLCMFEQYLAGRQVRSVMYEERNRLAESQKKSLKDEIATIRSLIAHIKEDLELSPSREDAGRKIWAHSTGSWEMVAELESKRLRAYGPVAAALASYLDPKVDRLLRSLQEVSRIARSRSKDT